MCSLATFQPPPPVGFVTVCETNGELVACKAGEAEANRYQQSLNYPEVDISKVLSKQMLSRDATLSALMEHDRRLPKRIRDAWKERGLVGVLEELALEKQSKEEKECPLWVSQVASTLLTMAHWSNFFSGSLFPHLTMSNDQMIAEFSSNSQWEENVIRAFVWHPHTTKFAVGLKDDSARVYSAARPDFVPTLKHRLQTGLADMAWKPFSASVLAIACHVGVLIWTVEPTSMSGRPSSSAVQVLSRPGHQPVTSLSWDPLGGVLATASAADSSILVWDIAMEQCCPLQKVGGGTTFLRWSPDGSKVLSASATSSMRVWETKRWKFEKWSNLSGRCKAACWSPDGSTLLFASSEEPIIYSLTFNTDDTDPTIGGSKMAVNCIDVSSVDVETEDGPVSVGGSIHAMAWDPKGERLAVQFKGDSCELVALFQTKLRPTLEILPCGFVRGAPGCVPCIITFQPKFDHGALLTVVWSNSSVTFLPLYFVSRSAVEDMHPTSPWVHQPQDSLDPRSPILHGRGISEIYS